ncbi:hypothetical protein BDM02DRAFT_3127622 [Thelephora ganbajun]|uniref:Uncharacterized protein n=1 Tax=Thelephora ganbajun TaxID=370292 RepID=A0ACB6ZML9_THEGA|nr:hypothetical protein BDM02DRAFT_3127622 [Thelephora ganbajun]
MAVAFQLGIDNTSPTIRYVPFLPNTVAQDATLGWTPYYTNSGFPSTSGLVGDGTSLQISSKNGSLFSVTWFGTGIDLYGNTTGCATFEVSLDRKSGGGGPVNALVNSSSNLLVSFSNLRLDNYTVTLTAQTLSSPSSFIAFDRAVITSAVQVNLDNVTVRSGMVDDASVAYKGRWSFQENVVAGKSFHVTSRLGDSAQLTFNAHVARVGTAVSVFGLRDPATGYYNVTLDGETTQYNAQSVWKEGAVLFYMTGLDPGRTHSLIITNAEDNQLAVGYINITSVSGVPIPTSRGGIPKGAIAGIVVGIFLGVIAFPVLGFMLWRRRRRSGDGDFTFIEPSIHKGYDITEVLGIQPGGLGQQQKTPVQSPISEVSLDLFPVTIPQIIHSRSKPSPPTFPRSPTTSSPSPTQHLHDTSARDIIHSPEAVDQYLSVHIRSPPKVNSENTPSPSVNRRSSVPKPSGPRPQSYRASNDDRRTSVLVPSVQIATDPDPTKGKAPPEPPEPKMQQINEGGRVMTYSFLDMNSTSGAPSTMEGAGQSQPHNSNQPPLPPNTNLDSPRHSLIAGTNSAPSRRDSDRRRESRTSKSLSLSAVIRQLPTLKLRPPTEPHPYSPYSAGHPQTSQSHRPQTGGASPTESIPVTTSEVSEIRFRNPGESSDPSGSLQRSGSSSGPIREKFHRTDY